MASENVINVEEFLEPISEEAPCGTDIREDPSPTSIYQEVKGARLDARNRERQLEASDDADAAPADWRPVLAPLQAPERHGSFPHIRITRPGGRAGSTLRRQGGSIGSVLLLHSTTKPKSP